MMFNQSCRNFLALIFFTFFIHNLHAQFNFFIDSSAVSSGILWKESPLMKRPPKSGDTTSFSGGWQAMKSLLNSRLNHDGTGIMEIRKLSEPTDEMVNTITLFPTALHYQFIDGSQPSHFDSLDGQYFVSSLFMDSVYKSDFTLMVPMSASVMQSNEVHFRIPASSSWTNVQGMWEVNFDDGVGWRDLQWDGLMVVQYDNVWTDRIIQFRFTTVDEVFSTSTVLKGSGVVGCDLLPHSPPWMTDVMLPWRISADYEGSIVSGNAYTLWSEDSIFDKPFIFVEGIDFNMQQWAGQLGDFGWCQFMGHDEVNYPMLAQSEDFVQSLRSRGYDLILLDFVDGATSILKNAALLKNLIHLCNIFKQGNHSLVVAGASMGGQVARVALAEMERDHEDHCTGIYVSWDSPHRGANIPLSIQATIDFLAPFSAEAEAFKTEALMRPAAKEMLIFQHFSSNGQALNPSEFNDFQDYLHVLGMPSQSINWAIANGSGVGLNIQNPVWTPLLETACDASSLFSEDEFKMNLFALPGNSEHPVSTPNMNVFADLIYSETYSDALYFVYTEYSGVFLIDNSAQPLDYLPGGFRTSVKELVDVVNENVDYTAFCDVINTDEYVLKHSFITTQSALNFTGNENLAVLDALIQNQGETPFDDYYVPTGENQPHVAMTPQNIQWLLNHLDNIEWTQQTALEYPCNPFNYGEQNDEFLFPTVIGDDQVVSLNTDEPIHCGEIESAQQPMKKMRLMSNCNQLGFVLRDKSKLLIGSESGITKCQLTLSPGSSLRLYDKSTVILGYGSQLIVGPGANVFLEDKSSLINLGGDIIVLEGGVIYFNGLSLALAHSSARLIFNEGTMKLAQDKTLSLQPFVGATGEVVIQSQSQPAVGFGSGSHLILSGDNWNDGVLDIVEGAHLFTENDEEGGILIKNGAVELGHNANWLNATRTVMQKVKLLSYGAYENNQSDVVFKNNKVQLEDCIWNHISLHGIKSHLRANNTKWIGNESQIWQNGSMTVTQSDMIGVGWDCEDVNSPFAFRNVTFSGNGNPFGIKAEGLIDAPMIVEECHFSDYQQGIIQSSGVLRISCSKFTALMDGIDVSHSAILKMGPMEGRNYFDQNNRHIVLNEVLTPELKDGKNWFGGFEEFAVFGLVEISNSSESVDWSGNEWDSSWVYLQSYQQGFPDQLSMTNIQFEPMQSDVLCILTDGTPKGIKRTTMDLTVPSRLNGITVYDCSGRIVFSDLNGDPKNGLLDLANLASGVYFVQFHTDGLKQTQRFFIP